MGYEPTKDDSTVSGYASGYRQTTTRIEPLAVSASIMNSSTPQKEAPNAPSPSAFKGRHETEAVFLFGIRVSALPIQLQFAVCVTGVVGFYLLYAYLQELIFTEFAGFHFGFFLTFVQFVWYSVLSGIHRWTRGETKRVAPLRAYAFLAVVMILAMGLANQALVYLNYPTQVLFKSCKLVSIMVIGLTIRRKKYSYNEYVAVSCLVIGLVALSLSKESPAAAVEVIKKVEKVDIVKEAAKTAHEAYSTIGLALVICSLFCDGLSGNVQEWMLQNTKTPILETIFYPHAFGALWLLFTCLASGQLFSAVAYMFDNPRCFVVMSVFSIVGYCGVQCFLTLTKAFGVVTAVVTTSVRKALTVLLSFLLFPKPFTTGHALAVSLVFTGVGIDVYHKAHKAMDAASKKKREAKDDNPV